MATDRSYWKPSSSYPVLPARPIAPPTGAMSASPKAVANWRNTIKPSYRRKPSSFIHCVPISKRFSHAEPQRLHRIFTLSTVQPFEGLLDYAPDLLLTIEQSVTAKGFGALPGLTNDGGSP